ncbi:MAG: DUF2490 domain-containing protein [Muribaculaceae bacterium]|nr:DUF2490 domain-containing protein [Muribaculaceae bacterium]
MTIRRIIIGAALLAGGAFSAFSQAFEGEASVKYSTPFKLDVSASLDYRTSDRFADTDRWGVGVDLGYKPLKYLKINAGYVFMQDHYGKSVDKSGRNVDSFWAAKNRVYAGVTGSLKVWKFTLSLRERYQFTYREGLEVPRFWDGGIPAGNKTVEPKYKHVLRSRLQLDFKPYKKCKFEPYVSYELYSQLKSIKRVKGQSESRGARLADKQRVTVGCSYKINKHNSVELYYRYNHVTDTDDLDAAHFIGAGYAFKF